MKKMGIETKLKTREETSTQEEGGRPLMVPGHLRKKKQKKGITSFDERRGVVKGKNTPVFRLGCWFSRRGTKGLKAGGVKEDRRKGGEKGANH